MGPEAAHPDLVPAALESIETSVLDEFLAIKSEWIRWTTYLERAEELKVDVRPPVYQRVVDDYARRRAELDERLVPMLAHVRVEYQKFGALLARLNSAHEEAQLRREELGFRHAVGELSEPELAEARREPDRLAAEYEQTLAAAGRLRARFVDALGHEVVDYELGEDAGSEDPRTNLMNVTGDSGAAAYPSAASGPLPVNPSGDQTFVLPLAALVENADGPQPVEHRLGSVNYIGRTPDNHIQVAAPNISRRHAVVEIVNAGYCIRDLESQNGTFVNGERIKQHTLVDGDHILVGQTEFVFQTPSVGASADAH